MLVINGGGAAGPPLVSSRSGTPLALRAVGCCGARPLGGLVVESGNTKGACPAAFLASSMVPSPTPTHASAAGDDGANERQALRLENAVLRCRLHELERANEELQVLAGLTSPAAAVSSTSPPVGAASAAPNGSTGSEGRLCANCNKPVPVSNYDAHIMHCERNFYRCPQCSEVVPAREREQHMARWMDTAWMLRAAEHGDLATLRTMRAHGVQFEKALCEETGETLIHKGARHQGVPELLSLLLGRGVPGATWLATLSKSEGHSALHVAAAAGHEGAAALLIESKADVNQLNNVGDTPLITAVRAGRTALVRRLVTSGADPEARTALGDTALQVAQRHGQHIDMALALGVTNLRRSAASAAPVLLPRGGGSRNGSRAPSPAPEARTAAGPRRPAGTTKSPSPVPLSLRQPSHSSLSALTSASNDCTSAGVASSQGCAASRPLLGAPRTADLVMPSSEPAL